MKESDKKICFDFKEKLDAFIQSIKQLEEKPEVVDSNEYLHNMSSLLQDLHQKSVDATHLGSFEITSIGEIVDGILTQDLSIPLEGKISMLTASQKETKKLQNVMHVYTKYKQATKQLVMELEILSNEIKDFAA